MVSGRIAKRYVNAELSHCLPNDKNDYRSSSTKTGQQIPEQNTSTRKPGPRGPLVKGGPPFSTSTSGQHGLGVTNSSPYVASSPRPNAPNMQKVTASTKKPSLRGPRVSSGSPYGASTPRQNAAILQNLNSTTRKRASHTTLLRQTAPLMEQVPQFRMLPVYRISIHQRGQALHTTRLRRTVYLMQEVRQVGKL